ncbi:hypothetical protein [Stutzerimonas nitrititolerans]|uniref:hypothetical protein n=1 Tax=Stutzerimonas nitrititolerans TaxID=2482751 RepID=UPI00289F6911|nr:hypothetical protein [Stutzerimonas nitrititolerans]
MSKAIAKQQLDMFASSVVVSHPATGIDPVAGFVPMPQYPNSPYVEFDGAKAKLTILQLCEASAGDWVESLALFRHLRMYPQDISRLAFRMVDAGLLEETNLYYGSSDLLDKNYRGYQHGYRLPQPATQEHIQ